MAERLKARPRILCRRREISEHPFGAIKQWMNQRAFLMHGLQKGARLQSTTSAEYYQRLGHGEGGRGGVKKP